MQKSERNVLIAKGALEEGKTYEQLKQEFKVSHATIWLIIKQARDHGYESFYKKPKELLPSLQELEPKHEKVQLTHSIVWKHLNEGKTGVWIARTYGTNEAHVSNLKLQRRKNRNTAQKKITKKLIEIRSQKKPIAVLIEQIDLESMPPFVSKFLAKKINEIIRAVNR